MPDYRNEINKIEEIVKKDKKNYLEDKTNFHEVFKILDETLKDVWERNQQVEEKVGKIEVNIQFLRSSVKDFQKQIQKRVSSGNFK